MPKSRNRKIKNKTNIYSNPNKYAKIAKVQGEGCINALVFAMMLSMAIGLAYSLKCEKEVKKVLPISEIEAAKQKIQNANTVNFIDTVHQYTR